MGNNSCKEEPVITDRLKAEDFVFTQTSRYGFPFQPTCLAHDPVQSILAIGAYDGSVRILGQPGVECHIQHESGAAVRDLIFLINEGALISLCEDDYIHLWNLRQAQPALVQSLRFNREKLTCMHLPFSSKWLYVGTERGNIHVVNIESFQLSGYTINWNKVIEIKCKTHPGPVVHISGNPVDPNKLLLAFNSGTVVVWSLRGRTVEQRCIFPQPVISAHWLNDGKQFMCSHTEGTLTIWSLKSGGKPVETIRPHTKSDKVRPCQAIFKVQWLAVSSGDPFVLFSGGTCSSKKKGLTLMQGSRSLRVLCTDTVIDFVCITSTPWGEDVQDPKAVVVLTPIKILVYDLLSSSAKPTALEVPYAFNIHESPVTCTQFYSECPKDFIKALSSTAVSRTRKRQLQRESSTPQPWPISGGILSEPSESATTELIVTGHSDGSVKFWAAKSDVLKCLYKLSTSKIFEKNTSTTENSETNGKDPPSEGSSGNNNSESCPSSMVDIDCFAVNMVELCVRSRTLLVAGSSHVIVYQFSMTEETLELVQVDISMMNDQNTDLSPDSAEVSSPTDDKGEGLVLSLTSSSMPALSPTLTCKTGLYKRSPGFQPSVCCMVLSSGSDVIPPSNLAVSSDFGVISISNGPSLALVDIIQKKLVTVLSAQDMSAVSDSPSATAAPSAGTAVVTGTPLTFTINADGTGGEFQVDAGSKPERRKSRPIRPPPPVRRLSAKLGDQNGSEAVDGWLRSRTSSAPVLDPGPPDSISCVRFACTFTKKNDNLVSPCLWVGTALGNVFVVVLNLPVREERDSQPVLSITTGSLFHPKAGVIQSIVILDGQGHLFPSPFQFWKEKDSHQNKRNSMMTREIFDRHFVVICTEREAKVYSLPTNQTNPKSFSEANLLDDDSAVLLKAAAVVVEGSSCLLCLTSLGKVLALSLPNLSPLMDVECSFLLKEYRFLRTLVFSDDAQALILCSPFEIQRLSMFVRPGTLTENQGSLFRAMETPEPPSKGFFSSLFSSAASPLDREQLFGTESGNASRSLTDRFNGPGMEKLQETSSGLAGVVARNKQALLERGEKLSELEQRTEQMNVRAKAFADAAHQLTLKYKDKKWYQV